MKALELRRKGYKDIIDLLLYTTSKTRKLSFLTRDRELVKFLKETGESMNNILYKEEFLDKYRHHLD